MRSTRAIVVAVTVAHAAVGTWIATSVPGPLLSADDLAYLGMARTIAGDGAAPLGAQPPYGILYPVLLAPGWAIGLSGDAMLTFARVVNALAGAALIPVLYLLVRRLTRAGAGWALTGAVVGASLPAAMATASIVWTERLLALLVAVAVLALVRAFEHPTAARAGAAAATGVALFATHPRMVLTAGVVLAAAVWTVRQRPATAASVATAGIAGIGVAEWLRRTVAQAAFASTGTYDAGDLASRRGLDDLGDMAVRAGGTLAYLVLATAGLALVAGVALLRGRREGPWVIAMLAATVAVAGWFLIGVDRADSSLHGRYVEVFAPVLVALALPLLPRLDRRWLLVAPAMVVAAGLYGAWAGPGDNWARPRSPVMMLGTEAGGAPFGNDIFEPGAATSVALVAGGLLVAASRAPRPWALLGIGLTLTGLGTASTVETLDQLYDGSVAGEVATAVEPRDVERVVIDAARVPPNLAAAVAWEVGFDNATVELAPDGSHLLLPVGVDGPPDATVDAELADGVLWRLG